MPKIDSSALLKEYESLLSLARQFLLQEHSPKSHLNVHPTSYNLLKTDLVPSAPVTPLASSTPYRHAAAVSGSAAPRSQTRAAPGQIPLSDIENRAPQSIINPEPILKRDVNEVKRAEPPSSLKSDLQKPKGSTESKSAIQLEKLSAPNEINIEEFKQLMKTHFPHYPLQDTILGNPAAQSPGPNKPKTSSIPPVAILSFYTDSPSQTFLINLAGAIEKQGIAARIFSAFKINQEGKWNSFLNANGLKLILASVDQFQTIPALLKSYKAVHPSSPQLQKLEEIDVLPIFDPSEYLSNPQLKTALWKAVLRSLTPLLPKKD